MISVIEWVISGVEILLDKTPILGKLKSSFERGLPKRQLSSSEVLSDAWISRLCLFLDQYFSGDYGRDYDPEKVRAWVNAYPNTFIVFVQRKLIAWPPNSERIISSIKVLPLRQDYCAIGNFESYDVHPDQMVEDERKAKALWVGDLVSTNNDVFALLIMLKYMLQNVDAPIYCRTVIKQLREILMERYGAKVINPTGNSPTKETILVLEPGALRQRREKKRTRRKAA